jgi:hypothetical protein
MDKLLRIGFSTRIDRVNSRLEYSLEAMPGKSIYTRIFGRLRPLAAGEVLDIDLG